jgi:hypothetical protein
VRRISPPPPHYLSPSSSLLLSLLPLNPPHYSSLIPLHPLAHYLSPSFLSIEVVEDGEE